MSRWILALALLAGCASYDNGPCADLCGTLADDCDYQAYPSFSSCYEGCVYAQTERNADIPAQAECTAAAQCNTFEIVECEHAYGGE